MLEEKVEELKQNSGNSKKDNIDIKIDLSLEAFISDKYFTSEIDKLNFYREIETLNSINDLNNLIDSFKRINPDFDKNTKNLFYILKLKLKARKFCLPSTSIKSKFFFFLILIGIFKFLKSISV